MLDPPERWHTRAFVDEAGQHPASGEPAQLGGPHQSALAPWMDQTMGTFPTPADCATCVPFMSQIATLPLVSCQRRSLLPSPLKSPVSAIDHTVGAAPTPADCVT